MSVRVRVVIVGAGPQGLTAATYLVAAGLDPSELAVIDPAGAWLQRWRSRFAQLRIEHLRSPSVHHPDPDPYALTAFARDLRRTDELVGRYGLPGTRLFDDFCDHVIADRGLGEVVWSDTVVDVDASGAVTLAGGGRLVPEHVVWATDPSAAAEGPAVETETARGAATSVVRWERVDPAGHVARVAVVGGGLTAAHLVERALDGGSHVEWITRRPVEARDFDTDPGWLGPKEMQAFAAVADPEERLVRVLDARGGGTVPAWMLQRLRRAEQAGRLCRRVGRVEVQDAGGATPAVRVDGTAVPVDQVWLAIGDRPCVSAAPPLARLCEASGVGLVGGRPMLDPSLRVAGGAVQVLGRLAQLRLGPTAGNLAGARRGAELVVAAVAGVDAMYALVDA